MIKNIIWDLGETLTTPPPGKIDFKPLNDYENIFLRKKVKDTLVEISYMNINQAILSNTATSDGSDIRQLLNRLEVSHFFKYIYGTNSELAQFKPEKPSAQVFKKTLEELNIKKKEEVVMVGNNWEKDILGANSYGMHAIWICNPEVSSREDYLTKVKSDSWILPVWDIESIPKTINLLNTIT